MYHFPIGIFASVVFSGVTFPGGEDFRCKVPVKEKCQQKYKEVFGSILHKEILAGSLETQVGSKGSLVGYKRLIKSPR